MSFAARETSRSLAAPIALFLITYGPNTGNVFCYTSGEDPVTFGGNTYTPLPVYSQDFIAAGSLDKASLEISIAKSAPIVAMFSPWPPPTVVTLQIFLSHVGETEFKPQWSGRVLSVRTGMDKGSDNQDDAVLLCEPISTSMRRTGLRANYQYGCPHVLYGTACGASQAAGTVTVAVSSVENPFVELPSGWNGAFDPSLFPNGIATYTDSHSVVQVRSIVRVTSSTEIQLNGDISTMVAGSSIALAIGCDHLMSGCTVHANIQNFGGQPWIPFKNPIGVVDNFN